MRCDVSGADRARRRLEDGRAERRWTRGRREKGWRSQGSRGESCTSAIAIQDCSALQPKRLPSKLLQMPTLPPLDHYTPHLLFGQPVNVCAHVRAQVRVHWHVHEVPAAVAAPAVATAVLAAVTTGRAAPAPPPPTRSLFLAGAFECTGGRAGG